MPLPEAFHITQTPLNLHKCLPTGGFLQTVVSDAPCATSRAYLHTDCGADPIQHFYEKVIKVKADVAAVLNYFSPSCIDIDLRWVTWEAVKGARRKGAFILTLDSSPVTSQSSSERSETQFS
jgi:hypothetical protein